MHEHRMAPRHHECQKGVGGNIRLEEHRIQVSLHMVDGGERDAQSERERLAKAQADKESAHESRPLRGGDAVDLILRYSSAVEGFPHDLYDQPLVRPRSKFGDDAPVGAVYELGGYHV